MDEEHNGTASASVRTPTKSTGMMGKEVCLTLLFRIIRPHSVSVGVGGEQKRRKGFSKGLGKKGTEEGRKGTEEGKKDTWIVHL